MPVWAPGQTLATLGPASPKYWHFVVEAKKLAFQDLYAYNADPDFATVPLDRLLSKAHAKSLCARVEPGPRVHARGGQPRRHRRRHHRAVDGGSRRQHGGVGEQPVLRRFGSGVTVPGYGISLHNRGGLFTLDPKSPNVIAPHKRPFNTLSAGFVMRNNRPLMTVTLMGGDMQAQGIAQVLLNVLDLGANLQAASDMARFRHIQVPNVLTMESPLVGARRRRRCGRWDTTCGR